MYFEFTSLNVKKFPNIVTPIFFKVAVEFISIMIFTHSNSTILQEFELVEELTIFEFGFDGKLHV